MSLVDIYYTNKEALVITDSVSTSHKYSTPSAFSIKCKIVPHYNCVVCAVGNKKTSNLLYEYIDYISFGYTFDEMLQLLRMDMERRNFLEQINKNANSCVHIIGWSEKENKIVVREYNSLKGVLDGVPESNIIMHPFKKTTEEERSFFYSYKPEEDKDFKKLIPQWLEYCKLQKLREDESPVESRVGIGGDLCLTHIREGSITTRKLYTFSDKLEDSRTMKKNYILYLSEKYNIPTPAGF